MNKSILLPASVKLHVLNVPYKYALFPCECAMESLLKQR